jgi:hypothetical protein
MAILFSLTLAACHQADHPANTSVSRRMALIAALKELRGRVLSGDKIQIGRVFDFPVPDSVFHPYLFNDSLLNVQFQALIEKNGGSITHEMFNSYFDKISGPAELEGFKGFFAFVDPDSLQHRDSIDVDTALANDHASRIYSIHILDDSLVDISYGTGHCLTEAPASDAEIGGKVVKDSVRSMKDTAKVVQDTTGAVKVDEIDNGEDDPSACEHMAYWVFAFDGRALHLVRQGSAD